MNEDEKVHMQYTLEEMFDKFCDHHERYLIENEKWISDYRKYNPGESLPDHLKCDFSFPKAMACICMEIMRLKKEKS